MNLEVIFLVARQRELQENFIKKKQLVVFFFKKEQDGALTNRQENVVKNIARYVKNINTYLRNFGKHLNKLQKHQYGLDYLLMTTIKSLLMLLKMLETFSMNIEQIFQLRT